MRKAASILVVDDDRTLLRVLAYQLQEHGYEPIAAASGAEALDACRRGHPDLVITDLAMPGTDGIALIAELRRHGVVAPVVVITAHGSVPVAVAAIKAGAFDFVQKPLLIEDLALTIERALRMRDLEKENATLRTALQQGATFEGLLETSPSLEPLVHVARRAAATDAAVLLTGESGTGKEMLARAVHYASSRSSRPFVPVNCAAIPSDLLESELFGYRKGAFTGAHRDHAGRIREAEKGTLFLDELADLPQPLQPKLLRFLQEGEISPLGESCPVKVDGRLIAATNRDLEQCVRDGSFRDDLFYRVNVVALEIPPLRKRPNDVASLVEHLLAKACQRHGRPVPAVSDPFMMQLMKHSWPGNVRELQNVLERALVMCDGEELRVEHLPPSIAGVASPERGFGLQLGTKGAALDDIEREALRLALERTGGNQTEAARLLQITRSALIYRMQKHGFR